MDHPNTQTLFRYWDELRAGRDAPGRSEIDPRRISGALDTMFILEALDDGQLRFRLAGTRLCEWLGMEARGCLAETVMAPGHERELADLGRRVLLEPGVGVMALRGADGAARDWRGEALLLPMRSELGEMARVLGCVNLLEGGPKSRPQPPLRLRCQGVRLLPVEVDPDAGAVRRRAGADPLGARPLPDLPAPGGAGAPAGFGEGPAGFARGPGAQPQAPGPRLTAIEGNPDAPRGEAGDRPRARPNLRLVKD